MSDELRRLPGPWMDHRRQRDRDYRGLLAVLRDGRAEVTTDIRTVLQALYDSQAAVRTLEYRLRCNLPERADGTCKWCPTPPDDDGWHDGEYDSGWCLDSEQHAADLAALKLPAVISALKVQR